MTIYNILGWGKGKTTSAIGIAARALMHNEKVVFFQFLKAGNDLGVEALYRLDNEKLNFIHLVQSTQGFRRDDCTSFYEACKSVIEIEQPNLIVFDELNVALDYGLLNQGIDSVIDDIKLFSCEADIYITGRINNHDLRHKMVSLADIATNCYCEAHSYNRTCKKCGMDFNPHYEFCPICGSKLYKSQPAQKGREC